MTRKVQRLRHDDVANLMSHLANLPERKKTPEDTINLSELFRSKAYMSEIKAALKKGYSFADLSKIFSERCGVSISERQIKYHYTRGMNLRRKKSAPVRKPRQETIPKDTGNTAEGSAEETSSVVKSPQTPAEFAYNFRGTDDTKDNAFSRGMNPQSGANGA